MLAKSSSKVKLLSTPHNFSLQISTLGTCPEMTETSGCSSLRCHCRAQTVPSTGQALFPLGAFFHCHSQQLALPKKRGYELHDPVLLKKSSLRGRSKGKQGCNPIHLGLVCLEGLQSCSVLLWVTPPSSKLTTSPGIPSQFPCDPALRLTG